MIFPPGRARLVTNPLPTGYAYYRWNRDNGRENLGKWIEDAAP